MAAVVMDPDNDAPPASARRPSTTHDRPSRAPFGPRIRTRTKPAADVDTPTSPLSSSALSRPDSPHLTDTPIATPPTYADAAVQTPPPSKPPSQRHAPTTFVAPPPLTPPPPITFEPTPIPWKGLPFDAAQWTFSSSELQEIVSKAIRLSARENFVRLLSLQALEVDIVHEAERLESERAAAQARWRFEVSRRTMFMQALNSTAASSVPNGNGNGEPEGGNLVPGCIAQLASSVASCDALLASVLHHLDQQSQIAVVQHQHWASALAVALRKLNKAYERQGQELKRVQARVRTLEDELEEAWREAEKMAVEFDQLEQEVATSECDSEGDDDDRPQDVAEPSVAHSSGTSHPRYDLDDTGTLGDATINTDIAVVVGVTATAVVSKATLVSSPGSPGHVDKSDTKSVRSVKSSRSRRSTRDGQSHLSRLSAARTRSRAASNASLRLPKALRSTPATHTPPLDAPPVPVRPHPSAQGQSFLDLGTASRDRFRKGLPPPRHPQPSVALPTPPHSAGLPPTRVPSVWLEETGRGTRLNGLDRSHSLQIFSSLTSRTPKKTRRSNLVMSLTGSDCGTADSAAGSPVDVSASASGGATGTSGSGSSTGVGASSGSGTSSGTGANGDPGACARASVDEVGPASPLTASSPMSLPTYALTSSHYRGPSASSSNLSVMGAGVRPGSASAYLTSASTVTTTTTTTTTASASTAGTTSIAVPVPVVMRTPPRRSLVSRASSVLLKRLSQATAGSKERLSPSRSREGLRLSGSGRSFVERWREREREREREGQGSGVGAGVGEEEEEEGEVMLIGSPLTDLLEDS